MAYRPPSREPKGRWARFLHAERKARGWSQQRAFEELRRGLGFGPKSRASFAAIDMGDREPTVKEAAFLVEFFGKEPEDEPQPNPEPTLAAALSALAEELRASREERGELRRHVHALEVVVGVLAQQQGVELPAPLFPLGTAG